MVYKEKFKDLENFETDAYMRNLAKLNRELRELEQRSAKGQTELESRIEGVNKRYNLVLPASYMDAINKKVSGINFLASKQNIDEKLGGEFDYNDFQADIDQIMLDCKADKDMYHLDLRQTDIYVPEKPSKADREYFERIQGEPGILEILKKKIKDLRDRVEPKQQRVEGLRETYGQPPTQVMPQAKPAHLNSNQGGLQSKKGSANQRPSSGVITVLARPAKSSNLYSKPDHLRRIQSKPLPCAVDLKFRKLNPDPSDYNTFFENPDPMDVAQIEKRRNQPYAEQLRDEHEATKDIDQGNYNQGTRRVDQPQYNTGRLPPTSDDPTARPPGGMRKKTEPLVVDPSQRYSGMDTQELVDRPVRKPSSASESRRGDPEYPEYEQDTPGTRTVNFEDMLGKQQRDTINVNDDGQKMIDEEVLKDRIRSNMGSMKEFFRKDACYKPFEGKNYSDEYSSAQPGKQQNMDSVRSQARLMDPSQQQPYPRNDEMVKQITDNFAHLLNDIMSGVRANHISQNSNYVPSNIAGAQNHTFLSPRIPDSGDINNTEQTPSNELNRNHQEPQPMNLQGYYQTLNNFYNTRQSQQETGLNPALPMPQKSISRRPADLDAYLNHLDSGRQSQEEDARLASQLRQAESSESDGEIPGGRYSGMQTRQRQADIDVENREKSEGELSDIGNRIFFD